MSKPNGATIYSGESQLNGKNIKAIITGISVDSQNVKTGPMAQLWILFANERPTDAAKSGADSAVCGECPHRPLLAKANNVKECYVNLGQAPNGVYKTQYDSGLPMTKKALRLGAYGEPTALPFNIVKSAVDNAQGHTGYTHQWKNPKFQQFKTLLMASVDSESEAVEAQSMVWRTFRVRKTGDALLPSEIACPASKESGFRTTCDNCQLCAGASRTAKDIAIIEH